MRDDRIEKTKQNLCCAMLPAVISVVMKNLPFVAPCSKSLLYNVTFITRFKIKKSEF